MDSESVLIFYSASVIVELFEINGGCKTYPGHMLPTGGKTGS
jgi:hypothetical protein